MKAKLLAGGRVWIASSVTILVLGVLSSPFWLNDSHKVALGLYGRNDARLRQILLAFKSDPDLASQARTFNGSVQIGNGSVSVRLDEQTGQLVSVSRSRDFYANYPYKPEGPHVVRSEGDAKAVMAAFIRDAGVEMESYEFEGFKTLEGEEATQAASGHVRKIYTARFVERKSDPRFEATASRSGSIVVDGQTGLILRFSSIILPPAAPWELNIDEARAKEIALDVWQQSGANIEPSMVRIHAKYVSTGSSKKILPEDRLIPGYVLGASSDADSWHCFAIIDGRSGKVMQNSCHIPSRMRGE